MGDTATEAMAKEYDDDFDRFNDLREATPDPEKGKVFDDRSKKSEKIEGKQVGDAGYAADLGVVGSAKAKSELAKGEYGVIASPVAAHTAPLEKSLADQSTWIAKKKTEREEHYGTGLTDDPNHISQDKQGSIDWAGLQVNMLERHMFEQWNWVNTYNTWAPTANLALAAKADLNETALTIGYDLTKPADMVRFVENLEQGVGMATELVDAKVLGPKGDTSWSNRSDNKGDIGKGPELKGEPITPLFEQLTTDYKLVETTQLGVYNNLLDARHDVLAANKANKEAQVAQINGVIAFWTNMASTVSGHWSSAKGLASGETAGKVDAAVQNRIAKSQASRKWNSAADRAQAGKETGLQTAEIEQANQAQERITGDSSGVGLSLSLEGVVGSLVSLSFESELNELAGEIEMLEKQLGAVAATNKLVIARGRIANYVNARKALVTTAKRIEKAQLANREMQYHDAGDSLDRYARAHASELKKEGKGSLVPKNDKHEVYSTVMLLVGKIRAYMLVADSARDMFDYNAFVDDARRLTKERSSPVDSPEVKGQVPRSHDPWHPPTIPATTKQEDKQVWEAIDTSYASVFGLSAKAEIHFRPLVDKVTTLLQKMKGVNSKDGDAPQNEY